MKEIVEKLERTEEKTHEVHERHVKRLKREECEAEIRRCRRNEWKRSMRRDGNAVLSGYNRGTRWDGRFGR